MIRWRLRRALQARARSVPEELWRLEQLRKGARRTPGQVVFRGATWEFVDGPSFYYQVQELFHDGCYDLELPTRAPTIVDCGGNMGLSAFRFRELFPGARITVFEADPQLAAVLARNLAQVGDPRTVVRAQAVWIEDGEVAFAASGCDEGRVELDGELRVPCADVARVCEEAGKVDLLKLDIEGAEYEVIERLVASGAADRVLRLVIEFHHRGEDAPRLHLALAQLAAAGFRYQVSGGRSSAELNSRPSGAGFRWTRFRGSVCLAYAWRPLIS